MVKLPPWSGIALLGVTLIAPPALHAQCSSGPSRPCLPGALPYRTRYKRPLSLD